MKKMSVAFGSDHGGAALKNAVLSMVSAEFPEIDFKDFGGDEKVSTDYPDMAAEVAEKVASGAHRFGVLFCGTGQGIAIAANKVPGIRAACVTDPVVARLVREHNDANVITLGGRITGIELAIEIVRVFLRTEFAGGRHKRRVDKIHEREKR